MARPTWCMKELLSLSLKCCDHRGDEGWERWPLSFYSLSEEIGRNLGCGMHRVGKGLGVAGREWEKSTTGAGKKEVHCL